MDPCRAGAMPRRGVHLAAGFSFSSRALLEDVDDEEDDVGVGERGADAAIVLPSAAGTAASPRRARCRTRSWPSSSPLTMPLFLRFDDAALEVASWRRRCSNSRSSKVLWPSKSTSQPTTTRSPRGRRRAVRARGRHLRLRPGRAAPEARRGDAAPGQGRLYGRRGWAAAVTEPAEELRLRLCRLVRAMVERDAPPPQLRDQRARCDSARAHALPRAAAAHPFPALAGRRPRSCGRRRRQRRTVSPACSRLRRAA